MKKIFFFFTGFVLFILFSEIYFQLSKIQNLSISKIDSKKGTTFKENKLLVMFNEGFSIGKTNSYGYLGSGYDYAKPANTRRVAILGDSYVEGFQLFDRHHIRSLIEKKLNKNSNFTYQVLNFGVSGFNLVDMYCYKENFASQFNNNIYIYLLRNDDLFYKRTSNNRPFLYLKNDSLIIDYSFNKSKTYKFRSKTNFIRGRSTVLGLIYTCRKIILAKKWKNIVFDKFYIEPQLQLKNTVKIEHYEQLNPVIKKIFDQLSKENSQIVLIDNSISNEIISELKSKGIEIIDPSKKFLDLEKSGIDPFYWKATKKKGHWNHYAHEIVSDLIVNRIENQ